MSIQSIKQLHVALSDDLKKLSGERLVSDATRKTFSTRVHGAVLEFAHKQADPAFWSGTKHYGSGPSSRFRIRRTAVAGVAEVKPKTRHKAQPVVAAASQE